MSRNILITGAGGFVGGHLLDYLHQAGTGDTLHGTISGHTPHPDQRSFVVYHTVDLRDPEGVNALLAEVRPDRIYHLAGQSYVPRSFEHPWETLEVNTRAALNLFEGVRAHKLNECRILIVGSAEMYGRQDPASMPLHEEVSFRPASPYSVSKIAQDMLAAQYFHSYKVGTVRVRSFNHIGPGQRGSFAIASFAAQIARIERGLSDPVVFVGDLSPERDFTDVRDVVAAYHLTIEGGEVGGVYNVCSGVSRSMQSILETMIGHSEARSGRKIEIRVDPARLRPADIPRLCGDAGRLRARTGWSPRIPFSQTLSDILDDWRAHLMG